MANEEQLKILKKGVTAWNEWRNNNAEIRVDLSDTDLRKLDLRKADLCAVDLSGSDLRGSKFERADLSIGVLSEANLSDANLCFADLSEANLTEANLDQASMLGANLKNADLGGADLSSTDMRGADLTKARLRRAKLVKTEFARTILDRTDFNGAVLDTVLFCETKFSSTSLKDARGLETCVHYGRSSIDYQTLIESGPLPEPFLRGCGLSEDFIHYLPSFWNKPFEFYSCFISYCHADKAFARRLHDALQGHGIRCWLDEHQLLPGDQIYDSIDQGIRLWDKVLLCCSEASLNSWWVDNEIQIALNKEQELKKERGQKVLALIPLNLDGYLLGKDWKSGMRTQIVNRLAADFTGWKKDDDQFNLQLERVIKALRADGGAREKPPRSRL